MKRFTRMILALVLVAFAVVVPVFAASAGGAAASQVAAVNGDTVTVTVSVFDLPAVESLAISFQVPEGLEVDNMQWLCATAEDVTGVDTTNNRAVWATGSTVNMLDSTDVLAITFKVTACPDASVTEVVREVEINVRAAQGTAWISHVVTGKVTVSHTGGTATCTDKALCEKCELPYGNALGHDVVEHDPQEATCEGIGWNAYETCNRCTYSTYVEQPALGHNYDDGTVTDEPSCTEKGEMTYRCRNNANHTYTEDIDPNGHVPGAAATCTTAQTCTVCNAELAVKLGHTPGAAATCTTAQTCTVCNTQLAPATGHTPGAAANCTTAQNCTVCNTQLAPATGHTPGVAATCTTAQTCTVCNTQLAPATGHTPGVAATCTTAQTCTVCDTQLAPAKGHTPGTAATCTTVQSCTVCHAELAPAKGHTPGTAATCTTAQTCTVCTAVIVPELGHKDADQNYACDVCDAELCTHHQEKEIPAQNATCTEPGWTAGKQCGICGDVLKPRESVPAKGHTPGAAATCTTAQTCTVCNAELAAKLGHTPGAAATCTTAQTCTVCNAELAAKLGHTPGAAATCTTAQTCTVCNAELAAKLGHTPGAAATCTTAQKCTACGTELAPAKGHSYNAAVTAPTCTEKGYTTHTCACGDSYVDTYVDATGHSFGEWYTSKPSTGNAKGEQKRECANCDHFETQERPRLGDVNGDGRVNSADAKLIMRYELRLIDATELDITVADVNGDGRINTGDAKEIMRFELKIIKEFSGVKEN